MRAVREGVRFGNFLERGRNIVSARRPWASENDAKSYLPAMIWEEACLTVKTISGRLTERFYRMHGKTVDEDHDEAYGIHYCEMIDPSIWRAIMRTSNVPTTNISKTAAVISSV